MTPRYRLRTLLALLAILPPRLAVSWWRYSAWKAEQERRAAIERELEQYWKPIDAAQVIWWRNSPLTAPAVPQPKAPAKAEE